MNTLTRISKISVLVGAAVLIAAVTVPGIIASSIPLSHPIIIHHGPEVYTLFAKYEDGYHSDVYKATNSAGELRVVKFPHDNDDYRKEVKAWKAIRPTLAADCVMPIIDVGVSMPGSDRKGFVMFVGQPIEAPASDADLKALLRRILTCTNLLHAAGFSFYDYYIGNFITFAATKSIRFIDFGMSTYLCNQDPPNYTLWTSDDWEMISTFLKDTCKSLPKQLVEACKNLAKDIHSLSKEKADSTIAYEKIMAHKFFGGNSGTKGLEVCSLQVKK